VQSKKHSVESSRRLHFEGGNFLSESDSTREEMESAEKSLSHLLTPPKDHLVEKGRKGKEREERATVETEAAHATKEKRANENGG